MTPDLASHHEVHNACVIKHFSKKKKYLSHLTLTVLT